MALNLRALALNGLRTQLAKAKAEVAWLERQEQKLARNPTDRAARKPTLTTKQRKDISRRMKAYWAARRAKE